MKKLILVLITIISFIPFAIGKNDYTDITDIVYLNSLGIEYDNENNIFTVYSYFINPFNLANAQISSGSLEDLGYVVKTTSSNFITGIDDAKKLTNVLIDYSHLETFILSTSFFNEINVDMFYKYIKDNLEIYPTFKLFTTDDNFKDIYNIKNFSDSTAYLTLLVNPVLVKKYRTTDYIECTKAYLNENYTEVIPHIKCQSGSFYKNDKEYNAIMIDGYSFFNRKKLSTILFSEFKPLIFLKKLDGEHIFFDNLELLIKSSDYQIKKQNTSIIIDYKIVATTTFTNIEDSREIYSTGYKYILDAISLLYRENINNNIDVFNTKYYSYNGIIKINIDLELK